MKKIRLLLFFLLFSATSIAQEFSPVGATWYYGFYPQSETDGYNKIEYMNDTIIDNQDCKILKHTMIIYYYPWQDFDTLISYIYIYQENAQVYYYKYNSFYLLYDFSSSAGQTWIVPGINYGCDSVGNVIVDSISSETINTEELEVIYLNFAPNSEWAIIGKVIEKMGAIEHFMLPITNEFCDSLDLGNRGGPFRCYTDASGFSYSNLQSITCDYINTGIREEMKNESLIFPNPAENYLFLKFFIPNISYCLRDLQGRVISCQDVVNSEIDISQIFKGTYIISIYQEKKIIYNQLIIKP